MKNLGIRILAYITFTCLIFMVFTLEISYEGKRLGIAHSFAQEHRDVHPIKVKENEKAALTHPPGLREIHLSPYAQKLAEIQVQRVERKFVTREVRMVGKVDYDETRLAYIAAWVPGRIDRLYVDFTGTFVKKGEPMFYLYSPELLSAQEELLQAVRAAEKIKKSGLSVVKETTRATIAAAREKLRLWGLAPTQINAIVKRGKPSDHMTIFSPISGVVVHKDALEGLYVKTGTRIYTIADLSRVWVKLDAYESDLIWIRIGQNAEFETEAYPGEIFKGTVAFIDPFLNPRTRTVKIRLNVPNREGKLKPEMFVHAVLRAPLSEKGNPIDRLPEKERPPLVIPASAPLVTGKRAVVYVAVPGKPGAYEGREIVLGPRAGDYYLVRHGLTEGELVVTNGNFKIDSAIQILAKPSMMSPEGGGPAALHEHGESPPMKKALPQRPRMDIPQAFKQRLMSVLTSYQRITEAFQSKKLPEITKAFSDLEKNLEVMDMSLLSGHPHMMWMEFAMLLENDAVEGMDARNLSEAEQTFQTLTRHIDWLRRQFALNHSGHAEKSKIHSEISHE
ncbi:MAG: efflux RND transporter periplasmic adaptor subunit [Deltaproteobacteria bacterium]|nr:efflux RND transporter periplasmic adaptor subunit [Deltaproteobacteria bacterium]